MKKFARKLFFATVCVAAAAIGNNAIAGAANVIDATGRKVEIADKSRIITIGGAVTEIVYALGFGDRVVAIDITSSYPPQAKEKPSIGYMRALSPEGVLALTPTLILAIEGSGPPDAVQVLSKAAVPFALVADAHDEDSVIRKVRFIAKALGAEQRGEEMAKAIAEDFAALRTMRKKITKRRKAVFVLAVGNGSPTVGGAKTTADGLFALAGIDNAIGEMTGYKPATAEATLAAAPDAVVSLMDRNHGFEADTLFKLPAFAGTPAATNKRLVPISSHYLNFGPRTAHAARNLMASIYPELALPQLPARAWTGPASAAGR